MSFPRRKTRHWLLVAAFIILSVVG